MTLTHQTELAASLVRGRRIVVATDVLVSSAMVAGWLTELGAAQTLVIGGSRGTGDIDPDLEAGAIVLGVSGETIMGSIRAFEAALDAPSDRLVRAIESFDPDGDALVVTALFSTRRELLGRPVFGARREAWHRLEDKTLADGLWDRAGVPRAPSMIVPAQREALVAAAADLDAGAGTVWVADNRSGWHGGGEAARWVCDDDDAGSAASYLAGIADVARVMPFLDGVPCSIHGWVIGDEVIVFRPCEMLVLRRSGSRSLFYAGMSTAWYPQAADADAMREVARAVGRQLRDEVGYRGAFTVDGVLTADGFRPTELNPRFAGGLALLGRDTGLPLYLLHCATIERPDLDWRPDELGREILAASERAPVAAGHALVRERFSQPREVAFRCQGDRLVAIDAAGSADGEAADGQPTEPAAEDRDGTIACGPSPVGGMVRVTFDRFAAGPLVAPEVARGFALAREVFDVDLPDLVPAPDLRPSKPSGGSA